MRLKVKAEENEKSKKIGSPRTEPHKSSQGGYTHTA